MRKLILSLILSGVLCVAGFAQSLNNVEQAVRYHTNIIVTALNQSISSTAIEYAAVADTLIKIC